MNDYLNNPLLLIIDMQTSTKKDNLGSVRTTTMHSLTFLPYWMMVTLAKTTQY